MLNKKIINFMFLLILTLCITGVASASIVLRVMIVNPSGSKRQVEKVKQYLPPEVKREDIISMQNLKLSYDSDKAQFYVYGEYDLGPNEVVVKEVELKDVWFIPENEIGDIKKEVDNLIKKLKGTQFQEQANFLKESITLKLDDITSSQRVQSINPELHFEKYRTNLEKLYSVKAATEEMKRFFTRAEKISAVNIWKFISLFFMLVILGVGWFLYRKSSRRRKR